MAKAPGKSNKKRPSNEKVVPGATADKMVAAGMKGKGYKPSKKK